MEIRPHVNFSGAAAAFADANDDPKPVVLLVSQSPLRYLVRVDFPGPLRQLRGLAFLMEGDKTMHLEATLDNVNNQLCRGLSVSSSQNSRIRRFYPPAFFGISFDFPEKIVPRIFEPRRASDGSFEFCVFKAIQ